MYWYVRTVPGKALSGNSGGAWKRMAGKKITIKDIAQSCGVGLGTASRAINGKPGVRDEIRRKIQRYCEEIGWQSNNLEGRLFIREPKRTAVFISSPELLSHESDNSVPSLIMDGLQKNGFDTMFLLGTCSKLLQRMAAIRPYCVIQLGVADFLAPHVRELLNAGIRVVSIGEAYLYEGPILHPDHYKAAVEAATLFRKKGHRKIAFFGGLGILKKLNSLDEVRILRINRTLRGILNVYPDFDLETDVVSDCFNDPEPLRKVLKKRLQTAWICSEERMCRILFRVASELGLRIPQDLSVILFSARLPFYAFTPDVTRFEMDAPARAEKALELLLAEKTEVENREYSFDFLFHDGGSIADLRKLAAGR